MAKRIFNWKAFALYLTLVATIAISFLSLGTRLACTLGIERNGRTYVDAGRSILGNSSSLHNLWNMRIRAPVKGLQVAPSLLIASDTLCNEVIALNLQSGQTIWTSEIGHPQAISVDSRRNHIYVYGEGPYITQLVALNILDGKMLWWNGSETGRRTSIYPQLLPNGELYAYISPTGKTAIVNLDTGEFRNTSSSTTINNLIADGLLWQQHLSQLEAIDTESRQVIWNSEYASLPQCCLYQIEVSNSIIVLKYSETLIALHRETGKSIWRSDENQIISNIAIVDNRIYALDINARLITLDLETGKLIDSIQFAHPTENSRKFNDANSIYGSWLFASDNLLGVYWNDINLLSIYNKVS